MVTQTVALLLCLAAQAAAGLLFRIFAWFLYCGLFSPGPIWPVRHVCQVNQVHTAPWQPTAPQLGQGAVVAVRSADVDLSVLDAHADPATLRMSWLQDDVTL